MRNPSRTSCIALILGCALVLGCSNAGPGGAGGTNSTGNGGSNAGGEVSNGGAGTGGNAGTGGSGGGAGGNDGGSGGSASSGCELGQGCLRDLADQCLCAGCDFDACSEGESFADCVCPVCENDEYCSNPDSCIDDGVCDPVLEGCVCEDCATHPQCSP
ncbi:MAG: hypothetical protein HOW73_26455 [Polyangiaceae bacterium]|nr:hypothetical protein [Polyangiaceae bacterium]